MDGADVAKIISHPHRGAKAFAWPMTDPPKGCLVLKFVRQMVVIAVMVIMKKAARRGKKLERSDARRAQRERPNFLRSRPAPLLFEGRDPCQPVSHVVIAKAPGRFLEVGLQVKNRVGLFLVPPFGQLDEVANQVLTVTGDQVGDHLITEARAKLNIAGKVSAVEKRDIEFQVVAVKLLAFRQRPRAVSDAEPEVPQRS